MEKVIKMKFTRYLYEESAVKSAFVSSLLNRSEDALLWVFELFYSGIDVQEFLTMVYEDFYATNNLNLIQWISSMTDAQSVGNVVSTMLISKFNVDIFLLRKIVRELEIDRDDVSGHLKLAYHLDDNKLPVDELIAGLQIKKKVRLFCEVDDIEKYETVCVKPAYKTLKVVGLKSLKHESLYTPLRIENAQSASSSSLITAPFGGVLNERRCKMVGREGIEDAYRNNWMYYAIRTPCWTDRLQNVDVDDDEKEVVFKTDEELEAFHEEYGYEPDEQPLEIQRMATCKIEKVTDWVAFYKKYRGLLELDEDILREL